MRNPLTLLKAGIRMARALRHPERLGDILALADVLAPPEAMRTLVDALERIPCAATALRERPRVGDLHLPTLRALPPGTLGRAFAEHLDAHGLDPAALPRPEVHTNAQYVRAHMLETHDVWHVLTGFEADVAGELGLCAFSLAQVGSPFAVGILAGGLANTLLFAMPERDVRMRAVVRGWLLGKRAGLLFGAAWARMWDMPLEAVRARFGLDVAGVEALLPSVDSPATLERPPKRRDAPSGPQSC
jgi:ubiquinone biosynthesis protein Coq4